MAAALVIGALSTITMADSDLWGHLRFGLDTLHSWRLPFEDPYSFTQDRPWINHEWMSELAMGVAWTAGGSAGLALLKGALTAGTLWFLWRALRGTRLAPRMLIFAVAGASLAPLTRTMRPQLWTCLFLACTCTVLAERRDRLYPWLPLLFASWANLHGGWIVGIGVLGVWGIVDSLQQPSGTIRWGLLIAACALATLANPYGWGLWQFLATTVRMGREITEWQPTFSLSPVNWVPWIAAVGFSIWIARRPFPNRLHVAAVLVMLGYASARVARLGPLFVEVVVVLAADAIRRQWLQPVGELPIAASPYNRPVVLVLCLASLITAVVVGRSSLGCIRVDQATAPDRAAVDLIARMPGGRLVTFFDWGEYALWHLGPRVKVSMDGRRETIYTDTRLREHAAVLHGTPAGLAVLEAWQAEYVWLPVTSAATRGWLMGHGYRLDLSTSRSFVATRADLPLPVTASVESLPSRCFPN